MNLNNIFATSKQKCIHQRAKSYWKLIRGDRPIGTLLLLWPTAWALWLAAEGIPPFGISMVFVLGVWLTRSAGCVINDYADQWLDHQVERTKNRPLVTGEITGKEALGVFIIMMLVAFGLVLTLNKLTILLSFIGLFLAASYPYLKRYTHFPQVYLGMAFGWGIPMAFAAVQGTIPAIAWWLYAVNIFWATAYDTWYAMVDRDDDIKMGSKSTAVLFAEFDLLIQAVLYFFVFLLLVNIGILLTLSIYYWLGIIAAISFVLYEFKMVSQRNREVYFKAFLHNNWVGLSVFAGIFFHYFLN